jgi:hypothetical protein
MNVLQITNLNNFSNFDGVWELTNTVENITQKYMDK